MFAVEVRAWSFRLLASGSTQRGWSQSQAVGCGAHISAGTECDSRSAVTSVRRLSDPCGFFCRNDLAYPAYSIFLKYS
uniref:Uncharacterized protein n=1 Tax=Paenibacillus athensensis TaxID=1967502 RepID=A0A4Y8Q5B1_9BACL